MFRRFSSSFSSTIGFVGIGNMGRGMIQNLAKTRKVIGYDSNPKWANEIVDKTNIQQAANVADVAKNAETVITMLPNDKIVHKVAEEIYTFKNRLIIDSSTISPFAAKDLQQFAITKGSQFVDAPVSGGVGGAAKGTLTFMVGADSKLLEQVKPILSLMGKNIFDCGGIGGGQIAKICNNMALAIQMISVAEALALGSHLGMDSKLLSSIMSVSSSRCWSVDTYNPSPGYLKGVPVDNDYEGGFAVELQLKDLRIAIEAAKKSNTNVALAEHATQIYETLSKTLARKDIGVIYRELLNNIKHE